MGGENMTQHEGLASDNQAVAKPAKMVPGKIYVVADAKGTVIGTARIGADIPENAPILHQPTPTQDHRVHEIDYTPDLHKVTSPEELHKVVARLIK
jgi:hypothetical protein